MDFMDGVSAGDIVTVFGESSILSSYVVQGLARLNVRVRLVMERPYRSLSMRALGYLGQVECMQGDAGNKGSLARALEGGSGFVNLMRTPYSKRYQATYVDAADVIGSIAFDLGLKRGVHLSSLAASQNTPTAWGKVQYSGERKMQSSFADATILRPSLMFGAEDSFFHSLAKTISLLPFAPLVGSGKNQIAPVYAGDVARVVLSALTAPHPLCGVFELGGPEVYTLNELVELVLKIINKRRFQMHIPISFARLKTWFWEFFPGFSFARDSLELSIQDWTPSEQALSSGHTFEAFHLSPRALELLLPDYLLRFRDGGLFSTRVFP